MSKKMVLAAALLVVGLVTIFFAWPEAASDVPVAAELRAVREEVQPIDPVDSAEAVLPEALLMRSPPVSAVAAQEADDPGALLRIVGRVVDDRGQPLSHAVIRHWPSARYRHAFGQRTDPLDDGVPWNDLAVTQARTDGRFTLSTREVPAAQRAFPEAAGSQWQRFFTKLDGQPALFVAAEGFGARYVRLPEGGDSLDVGDVVLQPCARLSGRLVDEQGRGVPSVRLALVSSRPGAGRGLALLAQSFTAETAADGRFTFEDVPVDAWIVWSEPHDLAPLRHEVVLDAGGLHELGDLVVGPGGVLAGYVRDGSGQPVADAEIRVHPYLGHSKASGPDAAAVVWNASVNSYEKRLMWTTRSDAAGAFRLAGLTPGESETWRVVARARGFDFAQLTNVRNGREDLELTLPQPASWWLTCVSDADGMALPDATVVEARRVTESYATVSASIDVTREGERWCLVGAGRETSKVAVSAPGYATSFVTLPGLAEGQEAEREVRLGRGYVLEGTVRADDGQPLAAALVVAERQGDVLEIEHAQETETDAAGRFRFEHLAEGGWTVMALADGCLPPLSAIEVSIGQGVDVPSATVTLLRGATLSGQVLDPAGRPANGTAIYASLTGKEALDAWGADEAALRGPLPDDRVPRRAYRSTVTAADGRFEFRGLPAGPWNLQDDAGTDVLVELPARGDVQVVLAQQRPPQVRGRVTRRGRPVAHAQVQLGFGPDVGSEWMALATARTDEAGEYRLEHEPGSYFVRARSGSTLTLPQPVELEHNASVQADIALPSGRLYGRAVDAEGEPIPGLLVRLRRPLRDAGDYDPLQRDMQTGPRGGFGFDGIEGGEHELELGSGLWLPVVRRVQVDEAAEAEELRIELELGGALEVSLGSAGESYRRVTLQPLDGTGARSQRAESDTTRIAPIAAGEYELRIEQLEGRTWRVLDVQHVSVVAGETVLVEALP